MSALKSNVISDLFVKIVQEPRKEKVEEIEVAIPDEMIQTVHGRIIPKSEAIMVIKRGKLVGWDSF